MFAPAACVQTTETAELQAGPEAEAQKPEPLTVRRVPPAYEPTAGLTLLMASE